MFVRIDAWGSTAAAEPRRGAVLPWFIVCGPVIVLALTWALFVATHRHRHEELKIALESAALAGAKTGGTLSTMRYAAAASWVGVLVSWWQLKQALHESGTVRVPGWLWPRSAGKHHRPRRKA